MLRTSASNGFLGNVGRDAIPKKSSIWTPTDPFRTRQAFRATWGLRFQHPAHFLPSGSMREAALSAYCTNTGKTASPVRPLSAVRSAKAGV
jgi:hypothetical protein